MKRLYEKMTRKRRIRLKIQDTEKLFANSCIAVKHRFPLFLPPSVTLNLFANFLA